LGDASVPAGANDLNKELKKIIKQIEAKGYKVVPAGKHQKVKNDEDATIFTLPTSPSGSLWRVRLVSELRKRGLID
jgi:predicted RNA binding protein YcfA (HicA-like mRNA interferase family)